MPPRPYSTKSDIIANFVPDSATGTIVVRVGIGTEIEGSDIVKDRFHGIFTSVDDEAFDLECTDRSFGAVECNCDVDGFETTVVSYGTDIPSFKGNHTRYLYGPGSILVSHGPDEALILGDLEQAVED
ncbi:hypothetical protein F4678DRAFT_460671 [Xylaria arbuscula]|nr:hypothetical protein F4678DRAFT_460671 [Xylaria arbuscula]